MLTTVSVKYLPDWFPGTGFKRTAAAWRKTLMDSADKPFEFVKRQMAQRTNKPSYVSKLFAQNDGNLSLEEERSAKWSAVSLYGGGADTVSRLSVVLILLGGRHALLFILTCDTECIVAELLLPCYDFVS